MVQKIYCIFSEKKRNEAMLCIEPSNLFSISEANRNFSNIAKNVDSKNDAVIIKNNKPNQRQHPHQKSSKEGRDSGMDCPDTDFLICREQAIFSLPIY